MKKSNKIAILVVCVILVVIAIVLMWKLNIFSGSKKSNLNISTTQEMKDLVSNMYEGIDTFPSVMTNEIDISDVNQVTYVTGLTSTEKIDSVIVSEPMIGSQAYSLVLVKVKNSKDADSIAKQMNENINARKWICVAADKVYTTSSSNIVCLVMSSEEMAKPVYDKFKQIAGGFGKEYVRDTNEGIIEDEDINMAL